MKCPVCKERKRINLNSADGYSQDSRECGKCGAIWTFVGDELVILSEEDKD